MLESSLFFLNLHQEPYCEKFCYGYKYSNFTLRIFRNPYYSQCVACCLTFSESVPQVYFYLVPLREMLDLNRNLPVHTCTHTCEHTHMNTHKGSHTGPHIHTPTTHTRVYNKHSHTKVYMHTPHARARALPPMKTAKENEMNKAELRMTPGSRLTSATD